MIDEARADVPTLSAEDFSAYLGRHVFASNAVSIDMPIDLLQLVLGHSIENSVLKRTDQSNPDVIRSIKKYLDQRPLVQILNRENSTKKYQHTAQSQTYLGDHLSVDLMSSGIYTISILSSTPCSIPKFKLEPGAELLHLQPTYLDYRNSTFETDNRNFALPDSLRQLCESGNTDIPQIIPCISDLSWIARKQQVLPVRITPLPVYISSSSFARRKKPNVSPADLPMYVSSSGIFICARSSSGDISVFPLPKQCTQIIDRKKVGIPLPLDNKLKDARLFTWNSNELHFCISRDAKINTLNSEKELTIDLLDHCTLFSLPHTASRDDKVISFTSLGNIQVLQASALKAISSSSSLISLAEGEELISVCFLPKDKDLLLATSDGSALRIGHDNLLVYRKIGCKSIAGLKLASPKGKPVLCMPYPKRGKLTCVSQAGYLLPLNSKKELTPHRRSGSPHRLFSLKTADCLKAALPTPPAVVILDNRLRIHCLTTDQLNTAGLGSQGLPTLHSSLVLSAVAAEIISSPQASPQNTLSTNNPH